MRGLTFFLVTMIVNFPDPLPLEGVKSRKREIYGLENGTVHVGNESCFIQKVSLSLSSRVVAIGKEGKALADVLCGSQEILSDGIPYRCDNLAVLHLGSHIVDQDTLTCALESKPQVVILSEPLSLDEPWAEIFSQLVTSDALRNFRGALVICVDNEEALPSGLCQTRWVALGGRLRAEEVCAGLIVIDDICNKARTDTSLEAILPQITDLVHQCFPDFENYGVREIQKMAEMEDWTVTSLSIQDSDGVHELVGYIAYKYEPAFQATYMARIAVSMAHRGHGHASYMVRWLMARSKQMGVGAVSAWAKPAMQPITLRLGFKYFFEKEVDVPEAERDNSWMVFRERPMELGLNAEETSEEPALVSTSTSKSKKKLKAARRREFKQR